MTTNVHRPQHLGIDIGGVIISRPDGPDGPDTSFITGSEFDALSTPPEPDAFELIADLAQRFDGNVWLVSKCGQRIEDRSRAWLTHHRFAEITGITDDRWRFCRKRPDKAVICAELRISHFVDDRLDVLEHLERIVPHRYWFNPPDKHHPPRIQRTQGWADTYEQIVRTLVR